MTKPFYEELAFSVIEINGVDYTAEPALLVILGKSTDGYSAICEEFGFTVTGKDVEEACVKFEDLVRSAMQGRYIGISTTDALDIRTQLLERFKVALKAV